MYRLLIVEDETILRNGLENTINWTLMGFEVVGSAVDGVDGLNKYKVLKPDVVLTDIRMPNMNGLKMGEMIKKENKDVEIVLLSGYDEFSYAKHGIEIGVFNYIMKLNMYDEIHSVFAKLKDHLDINLRNISDVNELEKIRFEGKIEELLIGRGGGWLAKMDKISLLVGVVQGVINEELFGIEDEFLCAYRIKNKYLVAVCASHNMTDITYTSRVMMLARELSLSMKNNDIAISPQVNREGEVLGAVTRAYKMLDIARLKEGRIPSVMMCDKDMEQHQLRRVLVTYDELEQLIELQKYHHFLNAATKFYSDAITSRFVYIDGARNMAKRLIMKLQDELQGVDEAYCAKLGDDMSKIENMYSIIDVGQSFKEMIKPALSTLQKVNFHQAGAAIDEAVKYVDKNYNKQISIEEIADMIHLSVPYFSSSFKKITGSNYSKYLRQKRMDKACELLTTTSLKIYEISHMVGYMDEKHFSKMFSKYIGETPASYRKALVH